MEFYRLFMFVIAIIVPTIPQIIVKRRQTGNQKLQELIQFDHTPSLG